MNKRDLLLTAASGITANKRRTALTMLGIVIGVAAVVLMVSIGRSFEHYILTQIESFGTNTMDIIPKGFEKFGGNLESLTLQDFEEISRLSTVESVSPVILVSKIVSREREEKSPMVFGTRKEIFPNYGLKLKDGRLLDESDEEGAKSVAVLSHQTALDLFGNSNPLGKKIDIGEIPFTVVGVLEGLGSLLLQDLDTPIYIPFSTARAMTGQKHLSYITLKTVADPAIAKQDVTLLLRQLHSIKNPDNDPDKDDFIARSAEQVTSIMGS